MSAPITIAPGDGIGPEIMAAALKVMEAAGADLAPEYIDVGEKVYLSGETSGIAADAFQSIRRTRTLFKGPITTPQGAGYKSLNVTLRKSFGLYANVRPVRAMTPFVASKHPDMDVVIVRENEEDLYAGIEHRQTDEVYQCLKLISRPGTERIVRYAFEYARAHGRKKVTCFVKDNIMKMTDGLFHKVFDEVAAEYPEIEADHWIVDIGAALLADQPERFDVIVMPNLYGDILSDVAAQIAGSVGLGGSANIGEGVALFEAIHGSAPTIAGQNVANPSGLMLAGCMMLGHLGQAKAAEKLHNAWLKTIEDGVHTADIYVEGASAALVDTDAFADAVIARMGQKPTILAAAAYDAEAKPIAVPRPVRKPAGKKEIVGLDVFVHFADDDADALAAKMQAANSNALTLQMITNRGVKVWPAGQPETFCTDHWRCRYVTNGHGPCDHAALIDLLSRVNDAGVDFIKTETLCAFDGEAAYSLGQGQ